MGPVLMEESANAWTRSQLESRKIFGGEKKARRKEKGLYDLYLAENSVWKINNRVGAGVKWKRHSRVNELGPTTKMTLRLGT